MLSRKHLFRNLLALGACAALVGGASIFAVAAEPSSPGDQVPAAAAPAADQDAQARDQSQKDKGVMEKLSDWWQGDEDQPKTISGRIVDLQTYLIDGPETARQSYNPDAALRDHKPVALLSDDDELYVILTRTDTASEPPARGGDVSDPMPGAPDAADLDTHEFFAGDKVTLTGRVYERNDIKGLLINSYEISDAPAEPAPQPEADLSTEQDQSPPTQDLPPMHYPGGMYQ
ncbi:MAG: hypothetical protein IT445_05320 [Phycisphaeraceae bacterium]|nr:hypothetical protein [Phycisphaeraceae bacterium]